MAQTKAQLLSPVGVVTATSTVIGSAVTITSTGINASSGFITAREYDIEGSTSTFNASGINVVGVVTATSFNGTATTANTLSTNATGTNLTLSGNLTVNGTQTTINTQILDVADKTVGVASTSTKTALTQDGAGLVIYGPSDINFTYDATKVAVGLNTSLTVTGIVTATSFSGSGANLTGLPAGYSDLDNMLFG